MKITTCIGVMALILSVNHVALGEESEGSTVWVGFSGFFSPDWSQDFSASIGAKVWLNEWTRDAFIAGSFPATLSDGTIDQPIGGTIVARIKDSRPDSRISEDIEPTPIPQLGIRYKWMFLTGSYYVETDFDFETTERTANFNLAAPTLGLGLSLNNSTAISRLSGERFEWDAGGGIYVLPNVAILGGYKKVVQNLDETLSVTNSDSPTAEPVVVSRKDKFEIRGPTIGIAASLPISMGFGIYGSYAHGFMDTEINDELGNDEFDADYNVAELGLTYTHGTKHWGPHLPLSAATAYVGYRYQIIETKFNDRLQDRTDITKGFAAGVNLSF